MTPFPLILIQHEFVSIAELAIPVQIKTVDDIPDCKLTVVDGTNGARFFRFFSLRLDQKDTSRYDSTAVMRLAFAELVHQVLGEGDRWDIEGLSLNDHTLLRNVDYATRAVELAKSNLVADLTAAMSPAVPVRLTLNRTGIRVMATGQFRRSVDFKIATPDHDHYPRVSCNNSRNLNRQARSFNWPVRLHGKPAVMYLTHYRDMTPTGGYEVDFQALGQDIVERFNTYFPFIKEPLELLEGNALTRALEAQRSPTQSEDRAAVRYNVYRHVRPRGRIDLHINWPVYQFAQVWEDHPLVKNYGKSFATDEILLFEHPGEGEDLRLPNGYYTVLPRGEGHDFQAAGEGEVIEDYLSIINTQPVNLFTFQPHDKTIGKKRWSIGQIMQYSHSHRNEHHILKCVLREETITMNNDIKGQLSIDGLALL